MQKNAALEVTVVKHVDPRYQPPVCEFYCERDDEQTRQYLHTCISINPIVSSPLSLRVQYTMFMTYEFTNSVKDKQMHWYLRYT